MKKFVVNTIEFVCKAYTYFTPAVYLMFALAAVFIAYYFNFHSLVGGVFLSLNVVHIILSSIFLKGADEWWDMKTETALSNGVMMYFVVGLCIWASPMIITDWMYTIYIGNGIALGINTAVAES